MSPCRRQFLSVVFRAFLLVVLVFCGWRAAAQAISQEAIAQIQALLAEKDSRTPAQRKIDSNLLYAVKMNRGEAIAAGVRSLETGVDVAEGGGVIVDIVANGPDSLEQTILDLGGAIIDLEPRYRSLRARLPLQKVEELAANPSVVFIQPKQEARLNRIPLPPGAPLAAAAAVSHAIRGKLAPGFEERAERTRTELLKALAARKALNINTSEGDVAHRADAARSAFGINGAGVKVGVLSDGVFSLSSVQGAGDLPAVTILPGQGNQVAGNDEGTAMLEIVHDLAPGAQLYFATAFSGITSFAQNIRDLRTAGCDIIVDDVSYFVETPFQNGQGPAVVSNTNGGVVIQAVADVTASGALYFSSAGNQGSKTKSTSGTWEGDFVDGGTLALIPGGNVHNFGGQVYDVITANSTPIHLFWSDPLGGSSNDYDLFRLNSTGTAVSASSTNVQSGTQDPYEQISSSALNDRIVILKKTGSAARFLHVEIEGGLFSINTNGETKGHNALPAGMFSVAATPAAVAIGAPPNPTGPYPGVFSGANNVELYTSDGPRRIFFNADSTPITPGNLSSTGGSLVAKPDITAADGVSCLTPGFSQFYGTSAAAPHAGAIAALLKSANPSLTPAQVRTILTGTAIDIETAGVDVVSGAGILDALSAVGATSVTPHYVSASSATATETAGNGDGLVEPGECGNLLVTLNNFSTSTTLTAVSATLSTTTPGVLIDVATSAYAAMAPGATEVNTTPFHFSLETSVSCPLTIDFTLTVSFAGGAAGSSPQTVSFQLKPMQSVISTILDTTSPAVPAGAVSATTGQQTGRIVRDGLTATCPAPKSNPGLTAVTGARQYDAYTFQSCKSQCVTVRLLGPSTIYTAAYDGSFNPANPSTNFLADPGSSSLATAYSFNVTAGQTFVVVVHEINVASGATYPYTLTFDGCFNCGPYSVSCCPTIGLTPASLPDGTDGVPYSQVLTPTAGTAPFAFSVSGLPAGMTPTTTVVGSAVTIGGTPTAPFSGTVTVSGTDANGCPFSQDFSLTVGSCGGSTTITADSTVGANSPNRRASVPAVGGATYVWTVGNGSITGGQGTNQLTYTAGASGTVALGVTVTPPSNCALTGNANVTIAPIGQAVQFYTLTPCRLIDTRNPNGPLGGPALAASGSPDRAFTLTGACGIPAGATSVSANLTVASPSAGGNLAIYRGDGALTGATSISFNTGKTRAGNALLQLALDGSGTVKVNNSAAGTVHFVLDVNGYFE